MEGELGSDLDRRRRGGVDDFRLIVDVIDPELDLVLDAAGLDDRHARRIAVGAVPAVEHIAHGENGLKRVALRASRRRDIRLAARHPDRVVENRFDGLGVDAARVVLNDDRVLLDDRPRSRARLRLPRRRRARCR